MWNIIPLNLGTLTVTRSAQICRHGANFNVGKLVEEPCIAWLLINAKTGQHILVDAGPCSDKTWAKLHHSHLQRSEQQELSVALSGYGIKSEDVDTVILTHLHWDHAYGIEALPNAKVYIQKKELCHAVAPLRTEYGLYENCICEKIPFFMNFYKQFVFLNGDEHFAEDLKIITLPGHSPGSQGVLVNTAQGQFVIAGDLISIYDAWELRLPCGIYTSMEDCIESLNKIENCHAQVLASHDYKSFDILKNNEL